MKMLTTRNTLMLSQNSSEWMPAVVGAKKLMIHCFVMSQGASGIIECNLGSCGKGQNNLCNECHLVHSLLYEYTAILIKVHLSLV